MKNFILLFMFTFFSTHSFADSCDALITGPSKLVCISWMGHQTEIKEQAITDYATAEINFTQGDWSYHADVIEGKVNAINLMYKPLDLETQADADVFPLNRLGTSLTVRGSKATLDCEIRAGAPTNL